MGSTNLYYRTFAAVHAWNPRQPQGLESLLESFGGVLGLAAIPCEALLRCAGVIAPFPNLMALDVGTENAFSLTI
jgi:hypothetical protein